MIAELPEGTDATTTFAVEEPNDSTTLSFQRLNCNNRRGGIYEIENADSA